LWEEERMANNTGSQIEKDVARKAAEFIVAWQTKMDFLKNQISALGKLSDFPIVAISVFLLKAQLVEFELKQLITEIDLHLGFSNSSQIIRRKRLKPVEMDDWSLGRIRKHLLTYDSKMLSALQQELKKLVDLRNIFTHKLFSSSKDVNSLTKDSEKTIPLADKVLDEIERVKKTLEKNDPLNILTKKA